MKCVALVGFGTWTAHLAPFGQPGVEVWGMNELYQRFPAAGFTRWFAMHDRATIGASARDPEAWRHLAELPMPVYMLEAHTAIPRSVRYPLEQVASLVGWYFTSTVAYMLGLAIAEGFEHISLYGFDGATRQEYARQRPCIEYLLGVAIGRGASITKQSTCHFLKGDWLYGYDEEPEWAIRERNAA